MGCKNIFIKTKKATNQFYSLHLGAKPPFYTKPLDHGYQNLWFMGRKTFGSWVSKPLDHGYQNLLVHGYQNLLVHGYQKPLDKKI